ncbi:hypothetical protein J6590_021487 [Homalodisca vitripennis]|nr:hypothetical protein J6590_021487 [Homalodisca vitripennis]
MITQYNIQDQDHYSIQLLHPRTCSELAHKDAITAHSKRDEELGRDNRQSREIQTCSGLFNNEFEYPDREEEPEQYYGSDFLKTLLIRPKCSRHDIIVHTHTLTHTPLSTNSPLVNIIRKAIYHRTSNATLPYAAEGADREMKERAARDKNTDEGRGWYRARRKLRDSSVEMYNVNPLLYFY